MSSIARWKNGPLGPVRRLAEGAVLGLGVSRTLQAAEKMGRPRLRATLQTVEERPFRAALRLFGICALALVVANRPRSGELRGEFPPDAN